MLQPDANDSLDQWLSWLEYLHPVEIELGLDRVSAVAHRAGLLATLPPIVTVAGTNGKGSVVAVVSAIYTAAGYKTGAYTSPHLLTFNERIRINGACVPDDAIVEALAWVERYRKPESLTYFEATTLAAMQVFLQADVDIAVLEVGLGGRLDAVNIWDTDCAVVTSIALDHESWLGHDRNTIAAEKVAIARKDRPLIIAETDPPPSLMEAAQAIHAQSWQIGKDYSYTGLDSTNRWRVVTPASEHVLPPPSLAGEHQYGNCAAAIAVIDALQQTLPVTPDVISQTVTKVSVAGRLERYTAGGVEILLDVAHNPAAARVLADELHELRSGPASRRIHAVFAVMADKDVDEIITIVAPFVDAWHCAQLSMERALRVDDLANKLRAQGEAEVSVYDSVSAALDGAKRAVLTRLAAVDQNPNLVLVFGSFFTVSEIMNLREAI